MTLDYSAELAKAQHELHAIDIEIAAIAEMTPTQRIVWVYSNTDFNSTDHPVGLGEQRLILLKRIDLLKNRIDAWNELTPAQRIAEVIHEQKCKYSHEMHCGWYKRSWRDPGTTPRQNYLYAAREMLHELNDDEAAVMAVIQHL